MITAVVAARAVVVVVVIVVAVIALMLCCIHLVCMNDPLERPVDRLGSRTHVIQVSIWTNWGSKPWYLLKVAQHAGQPNLYAAHLLKHRPQWSIIILLICSYTV
jgi:hypothetical protein